MRRRALRRSLTSVLTAGCLGLSAPVGTLDQVASPGAEPVLNSEVLTEAEVEELRSFFDQYDVELEDQVYLLEKLDAGDTWLSFDPASAPVAKETYVEDGMRVNVSTYEDGSVAVESVSVPEDPEGDNTVAPQSVYGGSVTNSAYAS